MCNKEGKMQKWEYLLIYVDITKWYRNGIQIGNFNHRWFIDKQPLADYLNKLGDEGWELVNAISQTEFVFKRPKT
jgi:hypothetical protein